MTYLPLDERTTLVRTRLLAYIDAVEGEDLHADKLLGLHRVTRQPGPPAGVQQRRATAKNSR